MTGTVKLRILAPCCVRSTPASHTQAAVREKRRETKRPHAHRTHSTARLTRTLRVGMLVAARSRQPFQWPHLISSSIPVPGWEEMAAATLRQVCGLSRVIVPRLAGGRSALACRIHGLIVMQRCTRHPALQPGPSPAYPHLWLRHATTTCTHGNSTPSASHETSWLRSHTCGELTDRHVGQSVTLSGWIQQSR